jgi:transcription elongation factor Elf1
VLYDSGYYVTFPKTCPHCGHGAATDYAWEHVRDEVTALGELAVLRCGACQLYTSAPWQMRDPTTGTEWYVIRPEKR